MKPTIPAIALLVGLTLGLGWLLDAVIRRGVRFGPADWVTAARAALVAAVTILVAQGNTSLFLAGLTAVALVLDTVDGQVARRTGTSSEFGARFDMEVDAFLILVLSVAVAPRVGWWVLAIGLMRYVYVAASWLLRWLRRPLFPRYWRKAVAAIQGIVLLLVLAGWVPTWTGVIALALLVESFGRDIGWQWRQRRVDVAGSAERAEPVQEKL